MAASGSAPPAAVMALANGKAPPSPPPPATHGSGATGGAMVPVKGAPKIKDANLRLHMQVEAPAPTERYIICGNTPALGEWDPTKGVVLTYKDGEWEADRDVWFYPDSRVEFKLVRLVDGKYVWEEDPNRTMELPDTTSPLVLCGRFNAEATLSLLSDQKDRLKARLAGEQAAKAAKFKELQSGCAEISQHLARVRQDWEERKTEYFKVLDQQKAESQRLEALIAEGKQQEIEKNAEIKARRDAMRKKEAELCVDEESLKSRQAALLEREAMLARNLETVQKKEEGLRERTKELQEEEARFLKHKQDLSEQLLRFAQGKWRDPSMDNRARAPSASRIPMTKFDGQDGEAPSGTMSPRGSHEDEQLSAIQSAPADMMVQSVSARPLRAAPRSSLCSTLRARGNSSHLEEAAGAAMATVTSEKLRAVPKKGPAAMRQRNANRSSLRLRLIEAQGKRALLESKTADDSTSTSANTQDETENARESASDGSNTSPMEATGGTTRTKLSGTPHLDMAGNTSGDSSPRVESPDRTLGATGESPTRVGHRRRDSFGGGGKVSYSDCSSTPNGGTGAYSRGPHPAAGVGVFE
mmetsp:Transcript_6293/g.13566  ORF Transcript_6293/g.13566 Transcript_6293/m.13566 type:complete len:584 (-) Transcript_6293:958-2709(-)